MILFYLFHVFIGILKFLQFLNPKIENLYFCHVAHSSIILIFAVFNLFENLIFFLKLLNFIGLLLYSKS